MNELLAELHVSADEASHWLQPMAKTVVRTLIYRIRRSQVMQPCSNAWNSHRWEIAQVNEQIRTVILYCNQCGVEIEAGVRSATV